MSTLKKLAIRAAIWTIFGYGANQLLRFCSNLILTRLLVPEYFGLMAVVNTLVIGLELFSDVGIGQSIIQNKRGDDPAFINTAWTIQVIRGFILWIFCLLLTFPAAKFYGEPRLLWILPIVGLSTIFVGLSSSSLITLNRQLSLRKIMIFDFTQQVLCIITMVILAWLTRSVWSLVIGAITSGIYRMVASYWLIPGYSNRFAWEQEAAKEILSFGKWVFLATAVTFLNEQADRLILAKLLSFKLLGVYTIAYTLAGIPRELIKSLSFRVIFPTISQQIDLPRETLRSQIIRQRWLLLLGFAVVLACLASVGDLVIGILYDKRYADATWMMPILSCGIWFSVLFYSVNPALLAMGKPLYSALSNLAGFTVIGLGLPLAYSRFGTVGAIVVIALSDMPLYIVNLYALRKEKLSCITQDIQTTAFFIGVLALLLIVRNSLGLGLPIQAIL
jgi:O-antigen/teichoic acid export membrane protein